MRIDGDTIGRLLVVQSIWITNATGRKRGWLCVCSCDERTRIADHGWHADSKLYPVRCEVEGKWHWIDGPAQKTIYLRDSDGAGIILGGPREVLTWEQVQDWIEGKQQAEAKKPLTGQRSLFGDE